MKRRALVPQLSLDRASSEALHRQLASALRAWMDSGDLPPGTALPSTRALASALGLSRNTVVTAYEELAADGRIAGREGSATRVVGNSRAPRMPQWGTVLRLSQYPLGAVRFRDPDSNALYFHR